MYSSMINIEDTSKKLYGVCVIFLEHAELNFLIKSSILKSSFYHSSRQKPGFKKDHCLGDKSSQRDNLCGRKGSKYGTIWNICYCLITIVIYVALCVNPRKQHYL